MKKIVCAAVAALLGAGLLVSSHTAADAAPKKRFAVSVSQSAGTLTLGQAVTLRGSVSPRPKKAKTRFVSIQQYRAGRWVTIRRTGVTAAGRYGVAVRPTGAGNAYYRVVKAGNKKRSAGASRTVGVGVYRWHYLTDFEYVDSDSFWPEDPMTVNGTVYKKSLRSSVADENTFVEYNLSRKCLLFTGVAGLSDSSSSDSSGIIEVLTDGASRYTRQFSLGQSAGLRLNVASVLRVRFEGTQVSGDVVPAIGSPRVLCKF